MRRAASMLTVVVAAWASALPVVAQSPRPRIWQGVYTSAQAERGRASYASTCSRCHNPDLSGDRGPSLKGERFMATWGGGSVNRLFAKIRDTMPTFATSTIDDATKLDIVTFILQTNGFPPGDTELAAADLEPIQILAQGEQPRAQNFARVAVFGCLARGDAGRFVVANASEPALAGDDAAAPVPAPGSNRVVLLNAQPFNPDAQLGQRVEARGLVYRDGADILLTVSGLKSIGACPN